MTRGSTTMTDLEKALAKIEEGVKELRLIDELGAYDIQNVVDSIRSDAADDAMQRALDDPRGLAA